MNEKNKTEPRKLQKPARGEAELRREDLVIYANESGGGGGFTTTGGGFTTTTGAFTTTTAV